MDAAGIQVFKRLLLKELEQCSIDIVTKTRCYDL